MSMQEQHWACSGCRRNGTAGHEQGASFVDIFVAVLSDHVRKGPCLTGAERVILKARSGKQIQPWSCGTCARTGTVEYVHGVDSDVSSVYQSIVRAHARDVSSACPTGSEFVQITNLGYFRRLAEQSGRVRGR